jgi:hypothetical protein
MQFLLETVSFTPPKDAEKTRIDLTLVDSFLYVCFWNGARSLKLCTFAFDTKSKVSLYLQMRKYNLTLNKAFELSKLQFSIL